VVSILLVVIVLLSFSHSCKFPDGTHSFSNRKRAKLSIYTSSSEDIDISTLPSNWDWRNVDGKDYTTPVRNQHIPKYCGSCAIFTATSVYQDRLQVAAKKQGWRLWPQVILSPQSVINYHLYGDCGGGLIDMVFGLMMIKGIMEESCCAYIADSGPMIHECQTYWERNATLTTITNHTMWLAVSTENYDIPIIRGAKDMMIEIYNNGPIACQMDATDNFVYNYTSGIYSEYLTPQARSSNHAISVGWASEPIPHWIIKNSWGTFWGENGYFRLLMNETNFNLGIEDECYAVTPDISPFKNIKKWLDPPASNPSPSTAASSPSNSTPKQ